MRYISLIALFAFVQLTHAVTPGDGPGGVGATDGTSTLELWLKADDLSLSNGAKVSTWNDASGNGRSLTQSDTERQPTFIIDALNGKPVLRFTESAFGDITLPSSNNEFSYVAVIKPARTGTYLNLFERSGSARPMLWLDTQGNYEFNFSNGAVAPSSTDYDIVMGVYSSAATAASLIYVNEATPTSYGPNTFSIPAGSAYSLFNRGGNQRFQGDVAEVIFYSTALTPTEVARIGYYLQQKYSVASNFAAPFKVLSGYSSSPAVYGAGIPIEPNTPILTGPDSGSPGFSISPALPAGFVFDPATGTISGTPENYSAPSTYTITVSFADWPSSSTELSLAVVPPTLTGYSESSAVFTRTRSITPLTPVSVGGALSSFSISPALPAGLTLDPQTGVISGTPTEIAASSTYTVTATSEGNPSSQFTITLEVLEFSTTLNITELMVSNKNTLLDGNGAYSDWIELHNYGSVAINIQGWHLTDKANNLTQAILPSAIIPPGGYLIIFASSNPHIDPAGNIHVNFSLSSDGEYVALVQPDGTTIAREFAPKTPAIPADQSWGTPNGVDYGIFTNPTPGEKNNFFETSQIVVTPSPESRTFAGTLEVTLNASLPERAVIRYTLNNTLPTSESPVYTGPLTLSANTRLRARVFEEGVDPGPEATAVYLKLSPNLENFSSNLPVMFLNTEGSIKPRTSDELTPTSVIVIEVGEDGRAASLGTPHYAGRGGLRVRGRTSQHFPQQQFRFDTWSNDNVKLKFPLLGLPSDAKWALYAPWSDKAIIRNAFTYSTWAKLGYRSHNHRFVEAFINRGGTNSFSYTDYAGIYMLVERPSLDRMGMEGPEKSTNLSEITGGFITEHGGADDSHFTTTGSIRTVAHKWTDPDEDDITPTQETWIKDYITRFEQALYASDFQHPVTGLSYRAYTDVPSQVDYYIIREWSRNFDGGSTYSHIRRGGKLTMGPLWDYNWAYGNVNYTDDEENIGLWRTDGWNRTFTADVNGWAPYWRRFLEDPDFKQQFIDRWVFLRDGLLNTTTVNAFIDELTIPLAQEAASRHFTRWPQLGEFTVVSAPGYETRTTYQSEVDYLKNFLSDRSAWIDSQFPQRPTANLEPGNVPADSSVTLTSPGNTIYYTVNGTDPRAPGGAVKPFASSIASGGNIPLTIPTQITARAYSSSTALWSAPFEAFYVPGTPGNASNVVLRRLDFAPSEPTAEELAVDAGFEASDFEFIELITLGPDPVNLSGMVFSQAISFTIPEGTVITSGGSIIIAKNPVAFSLRHGNSHEVVGPYSGKLDNDGETIVLKTAEGDDVLTFTYSPEWTSKTNGGGYLLTLLDSSVIPADYNNPAAWGVTTAGSSSDPARDFDLWTKAFFSETDLADENRSGAKAAPAGDGVTNLMKYALGASPFETARLPEIGVDESGENLTLTFSRPPNLPGITYVVESTTDLVHWTAADTALETIGTTGSSETIRASVPRNERAKLFLRLTIGTTGN